MHTSTLMALPAACAAFERAHGMRPFVVLACCGYADAHAQLWHPEHTDTAPVEVVVEGHTQPHPDAPV